MIIVIIIFLCPLFKVMSYAAELSRQETVRHSVSRSRFFKMFSKCFQNAAWHEGNSFSSHAQTKNFYCYLYFYCPSFKMTITRCLLRDYTSDYKVARHYNLERNYPEDRFPKKEKTSPTEVPIVDIDHDFDL